MPFPRTSDLLRTSLHYSLVPMLRHLVSQRRLSHGIKILHALQGTTCLKITYLLFGMNFHRLLIILHGSSRTLILLGDMSSHPLYFKIYFKIASCIRYGRNIVFLWWHSVEDVILKYLPYFKLDLCFFSLQIS